MYEKPLCFVGSLVACSGAVIAFVGFVCGFSADPQNIIQQTVQALYWLIGVVGILIFGVGIAARSLELMLLMANDQKANPKTAPTALKSA
jgi:hypothetical protein